MNKAFLYCGLLFLYSLPLLSQMKLNVNGGLLTGDKRPCFTRIDTVAGSTSLFRSYFASKNVQFMNNIYSSGRFENIPNSNLNISTDNVYRFISRNEKVLFEFNAFLKGIYDGILIDNMNNMTIYKSLIALGYYEFGGGLSFGIPVNQWNVSFRPMLNIGYGFRQSSIMVVDNVDKSTPEQLQKIVENREGVEGHGLNVGISVMADISCFEKDLHPLVVFRLENIVNTLDEKISNFQKDETRPFDMNIKNPFRMNLGAKISPWNYFDFYGEVLQMNTSPEYRLEISRKFETVTLALYSTLNEHTIMDYTRNLVGFVLGFHKPNLPDNLNFSIMYDNDSYLGVGFGFTL